MTELLDPQLRSVAQLFDEDEAIYTVPIYQRNYAWGAQQIEQLIGDVHDALADGDDGYFLGNLIVTRRPGREADYEVIDGQQRLTTLYLLLTILSQDGAHPYDAHRDRLRYESRSRASEALRRVVTEASRHSASIPDTATNEDTGIHEGYNVIRQFLNQHPELRDDEDRGQFADFLRHRVAVVRAALPPKTDLNRYFEIMNTRGQQLHQVDIVKARLMSRLPNEAERACFAWIWDACADMDSYVQMSLTRGDHARRRELFGDGWSWLKAASFGRLLEVHQTTAAVSGMMDTAPATSMSLDAALARYSAIGVSAPGEDAENVRFRSTIEFPAFLLHVLKVMSRDEGEHEGQLDDKRLIKRFDEAAAAGDPSDEAEWVRDFGLALLRLRNLFDGFILKRQYTASNGDDGDWSLQRLLRRRSKGRSMTGYINTLSKVATEIEEDGDVDPATRELMLIQSMLRVTYTSPRTMHWITKVLRVLDQNDPDQIQGSQLVDVLRAYARDKVREAFFGEGHPEGFNISRIVFTYVDYLLLSDPQKSEFRFSFRNSIEHFYPQHPDEQQAGAAVSPEHLNLLGNLALVSVGANSKFSNSLPRAKAENYRTTIEAQSTKLQVMAETTRTHGWGDQQVLQHHDAIVKLLMSDLGLSTAAGE
ncbi:DUF262 domain-containing protein [Nocardioides euryhalodurans]|uniref:DUF262 domain-containing protein n=1 Tax=Nocardioides euryhalodurans TaxID=2518370 RepID=A0A4P7GJE0_9ACTN|nr:DUF262 domain-containing protein [Nocardioides euryhalodurans]QBR91857.1 DUF262 domain-containing protein [Nocardioides euryhalodurans]